MVFQRQQFQDSLDNKRRNRARENRSQLRVLAQAEIPVAALTKSAEWDFFLSLLQAKIEALDEMLNAYQQALATDMVFDHVGLAAAKAGAMRVKVQIDTLQAVLELPKQIIETGKEAKLELVKYLDE